ncbi:MAG: DoxX family protein [Saprospiraceae bacterium]|nr:DoxX family protein [Saprospiraceae bacterium]
MTIFSLLAIIGLVALVVTLLMTLVFKVQKSWLMSYLQNFTGILFLFSGWVKAVDPLGTAFKMEDYFAEFNATFADTSLSFLAPMFPFLSGYSTAFAIFMIIFEMILGLMLIFGHAPKWTSILFFALVVFFTILTGFTFLTGYVPMDANFFSFGSWGEYKATNMRVTDCGCFGDFIKLDPKISFYKDLFLLVPSIYFLFKYKEMHQLFAPKNRVLTLTLSTAFLLLYCVYNFYWDEPHVDFRPFRNGANIAVLKKAEIEAANNVKVTAMVMKNKKTGELKTFSYEEYMKNLSALTDEYETVEQIKTEPTIKETKISHFDITDFDGNEKTEMYLTNSKPHLMVPVFKADYKAIPTTRMVQDSVFTSDTVQVIGLKDSVRINRKFKEVVSREEEAYDIIWDKAFISRFVEVIKPLQVAAAKDQVAMSVVISGIDADKAKILAKETGLDVEYLTADEKLLKTIMRSNPGIILWKDGVLLQKWHYKKLPEWSVIKSKYLK